MFQENDTTIVCIDIQEKLLNAISDRNIVSSNCEKMMKCASILNIDTIVTEQYPKGLGFTINSIRDIKNFKTIEKNTFSALRTDEFKDEFDKLKNKNVIIFGIETHICVLQSVIDLISEGYNVFVVSDCCSSRKEFNHKAALNLAQSYGAKIITLEIALFEFLKTSKHEHFKEIQALVK